MQAIVSTKFDITWFSIKNTEESCCKILIALIISNPICSEIGERYWFDFDAIGSDGDHVHIFVRAAPRHSPSKAMQIVKSITAREFFQEIPLSKETALGRRILELRRLHRNSR